MPRVPETVLKDYCDFCPKQESKSRAYCSCELCGQLVCQDHAVEVGFRVESAQDCDILRVAEPWRIMLERERLALGRHIVCVECSRSTLCEVVARLKKVMLTRHKTEAKRDD